VSIIVPVYNSSDVLCECVNSLINQDYENIEIILVDDGSTDNSGEICDSFQEKDKRVKVIHKKNEGQSAARNLGIQESSGDYVMFIDSDDWLDLDAVSTLVSYADENDLDVTRFNYIREFESKSIPKKNTFLEEKIYEDEECKKLCRQILGLVRKELSNPENINFLSSVCFNVFRKKILLEKGITFKDLKLIGSFEDGLFNFETFMHINRFGYVDRCFYHYRKTNDNSSSKKYRENYMEKQLRLFAYLKEISSNYFLKSEIEESYSSRVVYTSMELCFNALRGNRKYREVKEILKNEELKKARRRFKLKYLPLKWKIYYFFIKYGWTLPTYLMTYVVLKLKNKGA